MGRGVDLKNRLVSSLMTERTLGEFFTLARKFDLEVGITITNDPSISSPRVNPEGDLDEGIDYVIYNYGSGEAFRMKGSDIFFTYSFADYTNK